MALRRGGGFDNSSVIIHREHRNVGWKCNNARRSNNKIGGRDIEAKRVQRGNKINILISERKGTINKKKIEKVLLFLFRRRKGRPLKESRDSI